MPSSRDDGLDTPSLRLLYRGEPMNCNQDKTSIVQTQPSPNSGKHCAEERRSASFLLKEWQWEFSTWIFGTLAFGVLIVQVLFFRRRPVSAWNSQVPLSTMIAALSQVAQSALLVSLSACIGQLKWAWLGEKRPLIDIDRFDSASRGPNGSFWFLVSMPWRSGPYVASLASMSTILLLGFSTFAQQTVNVGLRKVEDSSGTASVSLATNFTAQSTNPFWMDDGETPFYERFNQSAALFQALYYDYQTPSEVPAICSSGNCTWTEHTTFAMCAETKDISTSLVLHSNLTNSNETESYFAISGVALDLPSFDNGETFWATTVSDASGREDLIVYVMYYAYCSHGSADCQKPSLIENPVERSDPSRWRVFRATLSPCFQTMSTNFNGSTATTVKNTIKGTLIEEEDDGGTKYGGRQRCFLNPMDKTSLSYCEGETETAGYTNFIASKYNATWLPTGWSFEENIIVADILGCDQIDPSCKPHFALGIDGFARRMNNFATALTNTMRRSHQSMLAIGTAWVDEQYFDTDLRWLILPAVTYFAISAVLFVTIFQSREKKVPLWKSSPLAVLHCKDEANTMDRLVESQAVAKSSDVQLDRSDGSWVLRERSEKAKIGPLQA